MGVVERTEWSRLLHAYGRATDTPAHLHALLQGDKRAREAAVEHLWAAINHQGSVYPATAPVARFVADHLRDNRVDPLRETLLAFVASVVGALLNTDRAELERMAKPEISQLIDADEDSEAWMDEDATNSMYARGLLGVIGVLDRLVAPVLAMLDHERSTVRAVASQAATYLALAGAAIDVPALADKVRKLANNADTDERCAHVMALGSLGEKTAGFLDDAAAPVRTCAALGKSNARSRRATDELLGALEHEDIDGWFRNRPPQFSMSPRFSVIAALLQRVKDFDRLAGAAVHVAKTTSKYRVDDEWGRLLVAAFETSPGKITTEAQRRYLAALVENAELWDPTFGNAQLCFRDAGLSYDRRACAALVRKAAKSKSGPLK